MIGVLKLASLPEFDGFGRLFAVDVFRLLEICFGTRMLFLLFECCDFFHT